MPHGYVHIKQPKIPSILIIEPLFHVKFRYILSKTTICVSKWCQKQKFKNHEFLPCFIFYVKIHIFSYFYFDGLRSVLDYLLLNSA